MVIRQPIRFILGLATALVFWWLANLTSACDPRILAQGHYDNYPDDDMDDNHSGNGTTLARRWTAIQFGNGDGSHPIGDTNTYGFQWPSNTIRLCFDPDIPDEGRDPLIVGIQGAMEMWYIAGLSEEIWRLEYLPHFDCAIVEDVSGPKQDFLWVTLETDEAVPMAANVGNLIGGSTLYTRLYTDEAGDWRGSTDLDPIIAWKLFIAHELGQ